MIIEYFLEVICKYATVFFVILCEITWGESHLYHFRRGVMSWLASCQSSNTRPCLFWFKRRVVDFFCNITRAPSFRNIYFFVDLVLECLKVTKCFRWQIVFIGSDIMQDWVSGLKGGYEGVAVEMIPTLVLTILHHLCFFSTAKDGIIELGVIACCFKAVS